MFVGLLEKWHKESISNLYNQLTEKWHINMPKDPEMNADLFSYMAKLHFFNFSLWHEEDEARRTDVSDQVIARVKRNIDKFNQSRNDTIQRIDEEIFHLLSVGGFSLNSGDLNSETPGSMIDRNSIMSLKVYHMNEIAENPNEKNDLRQQCANKVLKLKEQQNDLENCVKNLLNDIAKAKRHFKVYFQFKMYNDPQLNPALKK